MGPEPHPAEPRTDYALPMLFSLVLMAAPLAPVPVAVDQTPQLRAIQQDVRGGQAGPMPVEARVVRFLFAPGFSWDALPNYFEPNVRRLRELGLDAQIVPVDPRGTPEANGRVIAAAVKADPRPAVIIAHSKGGLDAIAGLRADKTARERVPKLVMIQSPYAGTPTAELVAPSAGRLARARHAGLAPFPDGGPEVFSISSRITARTRSRLTLWLTALSVKLLCGFDNDGIVAPEEAAVPGAVHAVLEHVAHADTISEPSILRHRLFAARGHDPGFAADLTEAIVRWIFTSRTG